MIVGCRDGIGCDGACGCAVVAVLLVGTMALVMHITNVVVVQELGAQTT